MKRLVKDNDGHWYVIPAGERALFDEWVRCMEEGEDFDGPDFGKCCLNMHPSNYVFDGWREG
jgi:hypothetical protein